VAVKAGAKATANEAMAAKAPKATSTMETSAKSPVAAKAAVPERQGVRRDCRGAEKTGCGERDSKLAQHDATPYRPTYRSDGSLEMDLVQSGHVVAATIRNTFSYSILPVSLLKLP
jgi:hypothetical protein